MYQNTNCHNLNNVNIYVVYKLYSQNNLFLFPASTMINNTHTDSTPTHPSTGSARCVTWGQEHYRTFDNKIYHYKGACQYVLLKDAAANSFHIHISVSIHHMTTGLVIGNR